MAFELLIHNFLYICSALISLSVGFFVLLKDTKKHAYRLLFLVASTYTLYCFMYLLSVNSSDTVISSIFAFLMILASSTVCFTAHLAFVTFDLEKKHTFGIRAMYVSLMALLAFFVLDPSRLRLESQPKLYFPNFFVPGPYYWIYMSFFFVIVGYFFAVLISNYKTFNNSEKNRLKYFFLAFGWGYTLSIPIYLNILNVYSIDMIYTSLMGIYTIPLAYGVFKYDLLNINVVVKSAFLYGFLTTLIGGAIIVINILNNYLVDSYSNFPIWFLPLLSGVFVVFVGFVIWNQIRQVDLLKYEFINNISHKFRTPLTHIRWLTEELRISNNQAEKDTIAGQMQFANMRLFELTNIVLNTAMEGSELSLYHFSDVNMIELLKTLNQTYTGQAADKKINLSLDIQGMIPHIKADKVRLGFALQVLFENALNYTPNGGFIKVQARFKDGDIEIIFTDSGIGIADTDLPHVFSKFYRSQKARHMDTEGMGLGLFMVRSVVEKHRGRVTASSEGEAKGATFVVTLPIV